MVFESPPRAMIVVMGVAGCGKSSLAQAWAAQRGWCFIEGDALHSAAARARMAAGRALDERHRRPWLARLARAMAAAPGPVVATASLLRRRHRQQLRVALPGLAFVHLQLPLAVAVARCAVGALLPGGAGGQPVRQSGGDRPGARCAAAGRAGTVGCTGAQHGPALAVSRLALRRGSGRAKPPFSRRHRPGGAAVAASRAARVWPAPRAAGTPPAR